MLAIGVAGFEQRMTPEEDSHGNGATGPQGQFPALHSRIFQQLRQRNVFRVALLYMVVCWGSAPSRCRIMFLCALTCVVVSSCASSPKGDPNLLGFLSDGYTTRQQVIERLGEPSKALEQGRICTYRLNHNPAGYALVWPSTTNEWGYDWGKDMRLSLVLIFDQNGLLQQHSLVRIQSD
jgi:hypothetical protein